MTRAIRFVVDVEPLPKQRARVVNGHAYTPAKTRDYETYVAQLARLAMGARAPLSGPIAVTMEFWRSDKRRVDLDNLVKACWDALNGVCYGDDSQVVELRATLRRGQTTPGARIEVREAND